MRKIVFGQQLDQLAQALAKEIKARARSPLEQQVVLVPAGGMRHWLLLELAKQEIVAGYRVLTVGEWIRWLGGEIPTFLTLASAIFRELKKKGDGEFGRYVGGCNVRRMELAEHLAGLFQRYGEYGVQGEGWQRELFQAVYVSTTEVAPRGPVYCFGIDFLPPCHWQLLERVEELFIYLFSPCHFFWEDVCSDWEKRQLLRHGKKKGVRKEELGELEAYLREAPALLANWGRLGRETLKKLGEWELEEEQCKAALHDSLLGKLQRALVEFEKGEEWKADPSLKVLQTGTSRFREVEVLSEEILELAAKGVLFSEMTVLAPNLDTYAPLIEMFFAQAGIPYRMVGIQVRGLFLQGLEKLLGVLGGEEEWEALFAAPAFLQKRGWEDGEKVRKWLQVVLERGVEALMEGLVRLEPEQSFRVEMGDAELLEEFVGVFQALSEKRVEGEKTLGEWATFLEEVAQEFLEGAEESFENFLKELRRAHRTLQGETFPFAWIVQFLGKGAFSEVHPHHLHGVLVAPFAEGNVTAQRALFLIGMDEESFPRTPAASSLDLLKGGYVPQISDRDRYLFLRALFSATEFLKISYGHLKEGKAMGPSVVVEELLQFVGPISSELISCPSRQLREEPKQAISWNWTPSRELPEGETVVSLSDLSLLVRHPWKFYLRKKWGIYLEDQKESLAFQKAILSREAFVKPLEKLSGGRIGEAISLEVSERVAQWKQQIEEPLFTALFLESCREMRWIDPTRVELPCLKLSLGEKSQVRIVGEVKHLSKHALITMGDDSLAALLKSWPEWLCAGWGLGISQVVCLKSGKRKTVEASETALKRLLLYFFAAQEALSPLLPEWADALLRGKKKKRLLFQDPVIDWVRERVEPPEDFEEGWRELLQETFEGLLHAKI